jgi:hypothetical protein
VQAADNNKENAVKKLSVISLGAVALGLALTGSAPSQAAVAVRVGVAAPADECATYRVRRPHRVVRYQYCNEPVWTGEPVVVGGVTYRENLHYRTHLGHREFWIRGHWVRHD